MKNISSTLILTGMIILSAGCGTISHDISADGLSAKQFIWPVPDDTNKLSSNGSYPTPETLRLLHPGLTKFQVQKLIGTPHFNEGIAHREWDYLFHLWQPQTHQYSSCQYKILFNRDGLVGSQYWLPKKCNMQSL